MSDQLPQITFETALPLPYDLEQPGLKQIMLKKIAMNAEQFGSVEAWHSVFRAEVWQLRQEADRAVQRWWMNQKQLEFLEDHLKEKGVTETVDGVDPVLPT